jgi:hypothetical protein
MKLKNQIFLYAAHFYTKEIVTEFEKIKNATRNLGVSLILYHRKSPGCVDHRKLKQPYYLFTDSKLSSLEYPTLVGKRLVPGSCHFPLIQFSKKHFFQYYWFIEYDVRFTGNWQDFFLYFEQANEDFLSSHIRRYSDEKDWSWWPTLWHPNKKIETSKMLRSFNPIYRISYAALHYIDSMHKKGWIGHNEVLYPTLLNLEGFKLRDFGGSGEFVLPKDKNRFYLESYSHPLINGTMRAINPHDLQISDEPKNKLVHPVKPGQKNLWSNVSRFKRMGYKSSVSRRNKGE